MKIQRKYNKISVLGGGLWGTALANHLAQNGSPIQLWEFYPELARKLQESRRHPHIPGLTLQSKIQVGSDLGAAVRSAEVILMVLPSSAVRGAARSMRPILKEASPRPVLVNASKGVEPDSLKTMGQAIEEELPFLKGRVFTLSGPSFAREVARGVPTRLVLAGPDGAAGRDMAALFGRGTIRVERSRDRLGVELAGALKNVLAVGCGVLTGLEAGANTQAALLTQGVAEMGGLIARLGGRRETIYGVAGLGDLILTGTSGESRNRTLGEKLGQGKSLASALREIPTVAEGVESAKSAAALCKACGFKAPLLDAVWRIVHKGAEPRLLVKALGF